MTDKVSLHQYGNSFQAKLIASLLTNRQFLEQIQNIIDQNSLSQIQIIGYVKR